MIVAIKRSVNCSLQNLLKQKLSPIIGLNVLFPRYTIDMFKIETFKSVKCNFDRSGRIKKLHAHVGLQKRLKTENSHS